jgi:4-diphosphocytidyl-2-C-methyl-D-erythritol kinase
MQNSRELHFKTPAKINFFLYIQNRREDGYHNLLMDLIPVSVFDSISLLRKNKGGIEFDSNLTGVPAEENLLVRAVRILENLTGKRFSLEINLLKTIPTGAGLGGGSGNAAGLLEVLNYWYNLDIPIRKLREIALNLGADVPFFIKPRPSLAEGVGDKLIPLSDFKPLFLLLLYPGFSISTQFAYSICQPSARREIPKEYTLESLSSYGPEINDFWKPLVREYPALEDCRREMLEQGAKLCGLSGSGSTLYGVFENESACKQAYAELTKKHQWTLFSCKTLPDYSYFPVTPQLV